MVKIRENDIELSKLFLANAREFDPERITLDPSNHGFIDPQGPI
jgi:hypothetical protein